MISFFYYVPKKLYYWLLYQMQGKFAYGAMTETRTGTTAASNSYNRTMP